MSNAANAGQSVVILIGAIAFIYLFFECVVLFARIWKAKQTDKHFNELLDHHHEMDRLALVDAVRSDLRDDEEAFHLTDEQPRFPQDAA